LCSFYLPVLGKNVALEDVFYFSALAHHRTIKDPKVVSRHQLYIKALESTGVKIELGRFKEKTLRCYSCNTPYIAHEEKETDVAIACKLMELFFVDACDIVVLVTGDTDLISAVKSCQRIFIDKK